VNQSLGGEKNCVVYSLFCMFIIIIITNITTIINGISIIISICFVALLNCLISTHEFYLLCISPPHPTGEKEER